LLRPSFGRKWKKGRSSPRPLLRVQKSRCPLTEEKKSRSLRSATLSAIVLRADGRDNLSAGSGTTGQHVGAWRCRNAGRAPITAACLGASILWPGSDRHTRSTLLDIVTFGTSGNSGVTRPLRLNKRGIRRWTPTQERRVTTFSGPHVRLFQMLILPDKRPASSEF